ncbi:hypothetical protein RIR_jg21824.t2 [Rhizophagus irregularis DAOM 181602=DAOM 197198]|nr:hypothetical protein RIR_jg21824.t2 [Rhizophagus irregularis DAOM 181602=DAOM 197198]
MILWTSLDCSKGDLWTSVLKRICGRLSDYIKELEKKGAGTSRAKRKITRLEGEERDEEGQERRQRRGQGRGKRGNVVVSCKY